MTEQLADQLRMEIQRANLRTRAITLDELRSRLEPSGELEFLPLAAKTDDEVSYITPTAASEVIQRPHFRWRVVSAAAVALLLAALTAGLVRQPDQEPLGRDTTTDTPEPTTSALPSPLAIVEARYEAINTADLRAIHADVAADVEYCSGSFDFGNCIDDDIDYHGVWGWNERVNLLALRLNAFGGALEHDCTVEGTIVTCLERETHRLLDVAGTEHFPNTVHYEVNGREIVSIDIRPAGTRSLTDMQVRSEEIVYIGWLRNNHPDRIDDLVLQGLLRVNENTVDEHRRLIANWLTQME